VPAPPAAFWPTRLSEDPHIRVLLLEAGGSDDRFLIRLPLGMLRAFRDPALTWGYVSEPEPNLNDRRLPVPRGRVLGGSSSINGMFFMRGHSRDFDGWQESGCDGWSYAHVLPYFKKLESSWRGSVPYHGDSGPMPIAPNSNAKLLQEPLMQTAAAAGFWTSDDLHARLEEGFARGELTMDRRGRRASSSRVYLRPALHRPNLEVMQGALTTRVLVERGRAVGVELRRGAEIAQRLRRTRSDSLRWHLQLTAVVGCSRVSGPRMNCGVSAFAYGPICREWARIFPITCAPACSSRRASPFPSCANCAPIAWRCRCCAGCCLARDRFATR
jgi:choline dehydrogenase-like flavoprotein